ncbi:uncharacterized protein PFL1_05768 [Pseudozyma flocculosa PF-1]|uniref:Major facilitator superfamily (MFS) profile domain-containing protein n=2 Tax=Pseudozyma flocculosa TaxID=84751 RepID=A0A061H4B9_9BASI|nr:uncharacterized protein PFL1_05768 [Pseudozyma flocculosa PF-1]EPQ26790.1 hypothetical protein PFL1_05768 [Pseudozyma flocculosa PF-1]SPO40881.1 probable ITR2 - myo-inositol transporter [Pseudozyma flocculosa]
MDYPAETRRSSSDKQSLDNKEAKGFANSNGDPMVLKTQSIDQTDGIIDVNELSQVLDEAEIEAAGQGKGTSLYLWALTAFSAIGGFLFGYDTGTISSVLVVIGRDLDNRVLSDGDKEFVTSALTVGAIVASLFIGLVGDKFGRKWALLFCDIVFLVGVIIQAACHQKMVMAVGRLIMGLGVGGAAQLVPVYIQEIAPAKHRGRLAVLNSIAITGGQVIAYAFGAAFANVTHGWRYIIAIGGVPPIFQAIGIHFFMPESPRHLVKSGHYDEAEAALTKMYPVATPQEIEAKVMVMKRHIEIDDIGTVRKVKLLWTDVPTRRAVFICGALLFAQQLSGFNSLMYFSGTLFAAAGLNNPTATGLIISGTNCLFTFVTAGFVDRFGRRRLLLITMPLVILFLSVTAVIFYVMLRPTDQQLLSGFPYPGYQTSLMLVFMVFYVASYATGLGAVPWLHGEFFGTQTRMVGTSISTACAWSGNLIISSTFLKTMTAITPSGAFGLYAGLTFMFLIMVYFLYPETAMLSLEEVRSTLDGGFNVKKSLKVRREKLDLWKKQQAEQKERAQSA